MTLATQLISTLGDCCCKVDAFVRLVQMWRTTQHNMAHFKCVCACVCKCVCVRTCCCHTICHPKLQLQPDTQAETPITPSSVLAASGTSMSTPMVAGAAALLFAAKPAATQQEVK